MLGKSNRRLLVIADDIGIGPNTTTGILQTGGRKAIVTGSALLVNSPYTAEAVRAVAATRRAAGTGLASEFDTRHPAFASLPGSQLWFGRRHLLAARIVPQALVSRLARSARRWNANCAADWSVSPSWSAMPRRSSTAINTSASSPRSARFCCDSRALAIKPYIRRVQEPWAMLHCLPHARVKRVFLGWLGRRLSRMQEAGFSGQRLAGGDHGAGLGGGARFFRAMAASDAGRCRGIDVPSGPGSIQRWWAVTSCRNSASMNCAGCAMRRLQDGKRRGISAGCAGCVNWGES